MPIVEIKNLTKHFPDGTIALQDVSLTINKGEFLILCGKNGSGKTVLMRHMNGLYRPTKGEIFYEGESIKKHPDRIRQKIGLVFQNPDSQIIGQTVYRDTAFGPENLGLKREEIDRRVKEALKNVELLKMSDHRPHLLSGGEKKRLSIAGILAMKPEIIIFDEPFSNLDYPGVRSILNKIIDLHKNGHTIILITHDLEKALGHADRVVVMYGGRVVENNTPKNILDRVEKWGIRRPDILNRRIEDITWLK